MNESALLEPQQYTAGPVDLGEQDEVFDIIADNLTLAGVFGFRSAATGMVAPRDWEGAMAFARNQSVSPSREWTNLCQMFVRMAYGVPALYGTAYTQYLALNDDDKITGPIDEMPVGTILHSKGPSVFGHTWIAARDFANGTPGAWGTDMVEVGDVDKFRRDAPISVWGQDFKTGAREVNEYDVTLKVPKPKQNKRYEAIAVAIEKMERAEETANRQKDWADRRLIRKEIRRLKAMYAEMRRV